MSIKQTVYAAMLLTAVLNGPANAAPLNASEILAASDKARGGGLPGIEWTIKMTTVDADSQELREMLVQAREENSLATTMRPVRMAGGKLLQVGRNMWYAKPELRKPISISPRQKLSGPAANGDIASTNYVLDYDARLLREDKVGNEQAYVLDLTARNKWVTYDRIVYWVSASRLVALKAEFYTVSGKLFKTAVFEHGNTINFHGATTPFVSKMTIQDAINKDHYSVLEYSDVQVKQLSPVTFNASALAN
jgi:hypothetical protein